MKVMIISSVISLVVIFLAFYLPHRFWSNYTFPRWKWYVLKVTAIVSIISWILIHVIVFLLTNLLS